MRVRIAHGNAQHQRRHPARRKVDAAAADVDAAIALTCAILRALTPDVLRLLNPMA